MARELAIAVRDFEIVERTIKQDVNRKLTADMLAAGALHQEFAEVEAREGRDHLIATALGQINERNRQPQLSQAEQGEATEAARLKKLYDSFPRQSPITGQPPSMFVIGNAEDALTFRKCVESSNSQLPVRLLPG
jgi:hypothetical protein